MTPDAYIRNEYSEKPVLVVKKTERTCIVAFENGNTRRFNYRKQVKQYIEEGAISVYRGEYLDFNVERCVHIAAERESQKTYRANAGLIAQWMEGKTRAYRSEFSDEEKTAIDLALGILRPVFQKP